MAHTHKNFENNYLIMIELHYLTHSEIIINIITLYL
jgi:hypothetical protein